MKINKSDAEKIADEIFDMIDRNHPRGLIKSELVDLLIRYTPPILEEPCEWQPPTTNELYNTYITTQPFTVTPDVTFIVGDEAMDHLRKEAKKIDEEHTKDILRELGYYFNTPTLPGKDFCGND